MTIYKNTKGINLSPELSARITRTIKITDKPLRSLDLENITDMLDGSIMLGLKKPVPISSDGGLIRVAAIKNALQVIEIHQEHIKKPSMEFHKEPSEFVSKIQEVRNLRAIIGFTLPKDLFEAIKTKIISENQQVRG